MWLNILASAPHRHAGLTPGTLRKVCVEPDMARSGLGYEAAFGLGSCMSFYRGLRHTYTWEPRLLHSPSHILVGPMARSNR